MSSKRKPTFQHRSLRTAVDATVRLAELEPEDAGLVRLARTYADEIDRAMREGEGQERTKALYLGPHLTNVLREMHATPAARQAARKPEVESGKSAKLTALRGGRAAG